MLLLSNAGAFSFLGPYASWMDQTKSYHLRGDIGGPMNINEGYRWNMPVITYGFERSFLNYFGSNGIAAVESAIQILNQLPPASLINVTNFPADAWRYNYQAHSLNVLDLKSTVLSSILEQMGLAAPERYAFCIRDIVTNGNSYAFFVIQRNFDPVTVQPSSYVNETLFTYSIFQYSPSLPNGQFCDATELLVDPLATINTTVAGFGPGVGVYATNLSRDDVGGLRYLLNGNNVCYENLLPDVQAAGSTTNLVRSAYRPGIEKVNFAPHPAGALSGEFLPFTNQWTDVYYAGDLPAHQSVERITTQPDILFTARDLGGFIIINRTDTTNWVNNAALNGNAGGSGPGVIQPPILITLNNVGPVRYNSGPFNLDEAASTLIQAWGSFDGSTNPVVTYPSGFVAFQPSEIRFKLEVGGRTNEFRWFLSGVPYGRFLFETSTNLTSWNTLTTFTNSGAVFTYSFNSLTNEARRFFRTAPE